jgi:hypothetical protein
MKTSTGEKLNILKREFKNKRSVAIRVVGSDQEFLVKDVRALQTNVEFTLDRRGGRLIVDPDDIRSIRLHEPTGSQVEAQ